MIAYQIDTKNGKERISTTAKNIERRKGMAFKCPYCGNEGIPRVTTVVSTMGWVVFVILLLGCFPLCWLPFVIKGLKEEQRRCSACGIKLG